MEASLIISYRCNARCLMCHTWRYPGKAADEFPPNLVNKIPGGLKFINITGGEPFIREDLDQIIQIAISKTDRLLISTNGYFTGRIVRLAEKYGNRVGIRISIEGLSRTNDALRGIKGGFDQGLRTLLALRDMGIKDIGVAVTVSDKNAKDMIQLYRLADAMDMEFATAITHNSYYFHKHDNRLEDTGMIAAEFEQIASELLRTNKPKNWFRAYFNMGLANKASGKKRPLPCEAGTDFFFLDPCGNIMACNGSDEPMILGNLNEQSFSELWGGATAEEIRKQVTECPKQCWMIGSASPAMKKRTWMPARWVLKNKLKLIMGKGKGVSLGPVEPMI